MKHLLSVLCMFLFTIISQAESLYIQQFKSATINNTDLQKSHQQIKSHKDIIVKSGLFVPSFHQQKEAPMADRKSFCSNCHLNPPHTKNKRKRSFLNMHSRYISCETCHFMPKNIQLEYRWLNFNRDNNPVNKKRITPFYNGQPVITFADHQSARKITDNWKELSSLEKAKLKLRLHQPLNKEGPDCLDCHNSKENLLNLHSLEFSDKKIRQLQNHAIPRFFNRFKKDQQRLRMSDLLQ